MSWIERPIFLCGHRKGGTTLLLSLMDDHPDLTVFPPDSGFWYGYFPRYEGDQYSKEEKLARMESVFFFNLEEDLKSLDCYDEKKHGLDFDSMKKRFRELMNGREYSSKEMLQASIRAFHEFTPGEREPRAWVEKTTSTEIYACEVASWFPEAKFVHLVRDPRDNFASLKSGWQARYQEQNDSLERLLQSQLDRGLLGLRMGIENQELLGKERYHILRYEDLVREPEAQLRKVCDFLGLEFSDTLLRPSYLGLPWKGNNFDGLSFSKPDPVNAGRWKERISPQEAAVIEFHAKDLMEHYGYGLEMPHELRVRAASCHYKWHNFAQVFSMGGAVDTYEEKENE